MLSKPGPLPEGAKWLYEPKWDGFRALIWKSGDEIYIQSRDQKPLGRYFPELEVTLRRELPERCVLDGEIVIATGGRLDFDALLLRIHPAASRVQLLAEQSPASYVTWDLLALGDEDLRATSQGERRERLVRALEHAKPPVHVTPATRDPAVARSWFQRFEGAGLDGVIAKPDDLPYTPGKRLMTKIKHQRTADCIVGGFRWYKGGREKLVGSLLLALYDDDGTLHHIGVTSAFKAETRAELAELLRPLREGAMETHPWRDWAAFQAAAASPETESTSESTIEAAPTRRVPGATSRWNRGKDLSWVPIKLGLICEVSYDHMQGTRFRHAAHFKRWRPDKALTDCRYDQLEVTPAFELAQIFG